MSLVQKKWCLGNTILPLETRSLDLVDLDDLLPEDDAEDTPFLLLNLKTTGNPEWLEKHLQMPRGWWRKGGRAMPLMKEILEAFPVVDKKRTLANTAKIVVPIKVRGKVFLVLNDRRTLTLAFHEETSDFESLEWFLQEMAKDLGSAGPSEVPAKDPSTDPASDSAKRAPVESENPEEDEILEEAISNIKSHEKCQNVWFSRARQSLKVVTKDKRHKFFYVKDLAKKRRRALERLDEQSWESVRSSFLDACTQAVSFLNEKQEGIACSSVSPVPLVSHSQDTGPQEDEDSDEQDDEEGDQA